MKILSAIIVITTAFVLARMRYFVKKWRRGLDKFESILLDERPLVLDPTGKATTTTTMMMTQSWEELPSVVQNYLGKVLPDGHRSIANIRMEQEGSYRLHDSWVSIESSELLSTNPPGYVWEATIATQSWLSWPTIQVCDAFANGEAYRKASWMHFMDLPLTNDQSEERRVMGDAMRWLGEAVFAPTILLPEEGLVSWESMDDPHKARLVLEDPELEHYELKDKVYLEATFNEDGFLTALEGLRPKMGSQDNSIWTGIYGSYEQEEDGIWVPTQVTSGFVENGELHEYYIGRITTMDFNMTIETQKALHGNTIAVENDSNLVEES